MAAFADAVSLGYRYIETDAQLTRDGVVVAFHDDDLERTCGTKLLISEMEWRDLANLRVDGREPIPSLEEVLSTWPDVRVNIDCKSDQVVEPLAALLGRMRVLDRVCVGSFKDSRLDRMRAALGPGLCTSMGPRSIAMLLAGSFRFPIGKVPGMVAQVPLRQGPVPLVTARFLDHAHGRGVPVHVWTVDEQPVIHRLLDLGVDGIMTDSLLSTREVFIERGVWGG